MPWEKNFDIDEAIDRATEVFWAKGYEAASLADLLKATGINKGSFYNAFGSKKKLFTMGLLKYEREQHQGILYKLSQLNSPIDAITGLFEALVEQSVEDEDKKGCLLVNTALDLPNLDQETAETIKSSTEDTERFFRTQIERGQSMGSIPEMVDPDISSIGLVALAMGLRVLARGTYSAAKIQKIKAQALNLIT